MILVVEEDALLRPAGDHFTATLRMDRVVIKLADWCVGGGEGGSPTHGWDEQLVLRCVMDAKLRVARLQTSTRILG